MASESLENRPQKISQSSGMVLCRCGHGRALHVVGGVGFCVRCNCEEFIPAESDPAPQIRFVGVGKNVMQGQECKAVACSKNMAKRIANALNVYQPSREGC